MVTIEYVDRKETSKGSLRRLRRSGSIPFVVYSKGKEVILGSLATNDFDRVLRGLRPGFLTTTVFVLRDKQGNEKKALVREVQYHPTSYDLVHIDFMEMDQDRDIFVKIPVDMINTVDCAGVKLGGQLRAVMRHVKVKCRPSVLPSHFTIDVKDVAIRQSRRVKDLVIPQGVTCLAHENDVVMTVNK
jgi:large subunit ribosomal protein L25